MTFDQTNFVGTHKSTCTQALVPGPLHCARQDSPTIALAGHSANLASLTPRQAEEKGLLTSGTYGHTHHLVTVCRPPLVFGEQVSSKDGLSWFDTLSSDMEGEGYAMWAQDRCSAGVTVGWEESQAGQWLRRAIRDCTDPRVADELRDFADWACGNIGQGGEHIRQRFYFVGVEHSDDAGPQGHAGYGDSRARRASSARSATEASLLGGLADITGSRRSRETNRIRNAADWLFCRDGKWRPAEPGTFPLAAKPAGRVGRLRAYGNAIDADNATDFIEIYLEHEADEIAAFHAERSGGDLRDLL